MYIRIFSITLFFIIFSVLNCSNPAGVKQNASSNSTTGSIALNLVATGLNPRVVINGPSGVVIRTSSDTIDSLTPGIYSVSVYKIDIPAGSGEIVGSVKGDTVPLRKVVVSSGKMEQVNVNYQTLTSSGKLWATNDLGGTVLAFDKSALTSPGTPSSVIKISIPYSSPKNLAFDRLGNLWVSLFEQSRVVMYSPNQLKGGTAGEPKAVIHASLTKSPWGLAFDTSGSLWITSWNNAEIMAYKESSLRSVILDKDSTRVPDIILTKSGLSEPRGICFDKSGNLWVTCSVENSGKSQIIEISSSNLAASAQITEVAALSADTALIGVCDVKFDKSGNMWGTCVRELFKLTPSQISASGTPGPVLERSFVMPSGLAFDAAGNVWVTNGDNNTIYRYVTNSSDQAVPYVMSTELKYPAGLTFFPVP